ncbi:MAG TPA: hypothetical protein VFX15_03175 [Actinomycetes bacterium]|nr:hypothetical protein [Actinomycetes bacterium]
MSDVASYLTGSIYQPDILALAMSRGYDDEAHRQAILDDVENNDARLDSDAVTLTHPANWLTEEEMERLPR